MTNQTVYLTPEGRQSLEAQRSQLLIQRREITKRIQEEREFGAFAEGGDFDEAKNELAFVEGKIRSIEQQLRNAVVVKEHTTRIVGLGSHVVVRRTDGSEGTYTIVGSPEANPREGRISNESPIGRALVGKGVGDEISVQVPAGLLSLTVLEIT